MIPSLRRIAQKKVLGQHSITTLATTGKLYGFDPATQKIHPSSRFSDQNFLVSSEKEGMLTLNAQGRIYTDRTVARITGKKIITPGTPDFIQMENLQDLLKSGVERAFMSENMLFDGKPLTVESINSAKLFQPTKTFLTQIVKREHISFENMQDAVVAIPETAMFMQRAFKENAGRIPNGLFQQIKSDRLFNGGQTHPVNSATGAFLSNDPFARVAIQLATPINCGTSGSTNAMMLGFFNTNILLKRSTKLPLDLMVNLLHGHFAGAYVVEFIGKKIHGTVMDREDIEPELKKMLVYSGVGQTHTLGEVWAAALRTQAYTDNPSNSLSAPDIESMMFEAVALANSSYDATEHTGDV